MTGTRNNDTSIELVRRERPEGEIPMELRQRLSRVIDSFPRDVRDKQREIPREPCQKARLLIHRRSSYV